MEKNLFKILVLSDYYLPGYKCGGSMRSLMNMVSWLGDQFCFKIITRAHDLGDVKPYPNIIVDSWQPVGKAEVFYASSKSYSCKNLRELISSTECDVLYLTSFFSPIFTIKPLILRKLGFTPQKPVFLAPKGEFSINALKINSYKKRPFLFLAKVFGLYNNIFWQASTELEAMDIRRWFGNKINIIIAPDLPAFATDSEKNQVKRKKVSGHLKIIFLSRITRKKNLNSALSLLKGLKGEIEFNIYGPIEDQRYWEECQEIIKILPHNIKLEYKGPIMHNQVPNVFEAHDLFFFPTLGENFGYVILEALISGCPVLISDQTPWNNLQEKEVGWDLPLNQPAFFIQCLQNCIDMDNQSYQILSQNAREFGKRYCMDKNVIASNYDLFRVVML